MHPWARSVLVLAVVATVVAAPAAGIASSTTVDSGTATDLVDRPGPNGATDDGSTDLLSLELDDDDDEEDEVDGDDGESEEDDERDDDDAIEEDDERDDDDAIEEDDERDEDDEEDESWLNWLSDDDENEGDQERGNAGNDNSGVERGNEDRSSDSRSSEQSSDEAGTESDRPDDSPSGVDDTAADRTERVDSQEDGEGQEGADGETQEGNGTQEGGERNATRNETVEPGPDVGSARVTVLQTPVVVGQPLVVSATTTNNGTEAGRKVVQFEVEHEIVDQRTFVLQPNETRTVTFTHVFDTPGNKTFEVDAGLNRFVTVEERRPNLSVSAVEVAPETVSAGDDVTITAVVNNTGYANGTLPVALELFGEVVAVQNVTLATGESAEVTFTRTIYAPGSYEAVVENESATFQVTGDSANGSAPPADESALASTVETDGFGPLAALAGVLIALALALGRRE